MINLPICFKAVSLTPKQSYKCPSASEVTLKDMGKTHHCLTTTKSWMLYIFCLLYYIGCCYVLSNNIDISKSYLCWWLSGAGNLISFHRQTQSIIPAQISFISWSLQELISWSKLIPISGYVILYLLMSLSSHGIRLSTGDRKSTCVCCYQWPISLTWFYFNPRMDK